MSKLIRLPDGNAFDPVVIRSVNYIKGKAVMCRDAQQRVVTWVAVKDDAKGELVRDILIGLSHAGYRAQQPDWSFLNDASAS